MKKFILITILAVLALSSVADAAMTYGAAYYRERISMVGDASSTDPLYLFINEVETTIDGTSGVASIWFTPGTAPAAEEGTLYYDSGSDGLLLRNATAWVTIDTAGASSLGTAYTVGSKITAITDAVEIEVTDGSNNGALLLDSDDTSDNIDVLSITNAGDDAAAVSIQITGTAGDDIQGTADAWNVTYLGVGTFVGLISGASDIVMENSEIIHNTTNTEIGFKATEDIVIDLDAGTNAVGWKSNTGVDEWEFGDVDDLTGIRTIVFDADTGGSISVTGNATSEDLVIQQLGTESDAGLNITSAGTGTDAIKVNASGGGLDIDAANSTMTITNTSNGANDDLTIEVDGDDDASIILTSDGTGGDAISLITSAATGDLKIASADEIDIDSVGKITIDLSEAAADFDVDSALGSVSLDGGEAAADAVVIIASATAGGIDVDAGTGGVDVLTTGVFSIDGAAASNVSVVSGATDENLTLSVTGATASSLIGSSAGTGDDAIDLNATAGGLDVDTTKSIVLTSVENEVDAIVIQATLGGIDILCDAASATEDIDIANTGGSVNINSSEAADLAVYLSTSNAAGQIAINSSDATADGIEIDSAGGIEIDAAGATDDIRIDAAAASVYIEGAEADSQAIQIDASDAAGGMDLDCGTGGFNLLATAGDVTITNTGALDIILDAQAGRVLITGTESAANAIHLYADGVNGEIYLQAKAGGIDMDSASGDITIDTAGAATDEIILTNTTGTAAGSIALVATAGGITAKVADEKELKIGNAGLDAYLIVAASATPANEDVRLVNTAGTAVGAIELTATAGGIDNNAKEMFTVTVAGGTAGDSDITLTNTTGTDAAAIALIATAGGIVGQVADGKNLTMGNAAGDAYLVVAAHGTAGSEDVRLVNTNGTDDAAIALTASAGGITAQVADAKNLTLGNAAGDAYFIVAAHGTAGSEDVRILNTNGTDEAAIDIQATAGGIYGVFNDAKDFNFEGGQFLLTANHNTADTIKIHADAGASQEINLLNDEGTGSGAIDLTSSAGWIDLNAFEGVTIDVAGGTAGTADITLTNGIGTDLGAIALTTTTGGIDINAKTMLTLDVAAGAAASADIILTNTPGTDEAAISLQAVAGGVDIDAALAKNVAITGGQVLVANLDDAASAISLLTNVGSSETIVVTNTQGEGAAAVGITATAGGVTVTALDNLKIEAAVTVNDVQTIGQDDATPDVWGFSYFNTGTNVDTITDFDAGAETLEEGHVIIVVSKAVITYDVAGGALLCGSTDVVTGAEDATTWLYNGTNWLLIGWINQSSNLNNGNAE